MLQNINIYYPSLFKGNTFKCVSPQSNYTSNRSRSRRRRKKGKMNTKICFSFYYIVILCVSTNALQTTWKLRKTFVWYASYGSNMNRQRFYCYIQGGQVEGMKRPGKGSRDKSLPKDTKWMTVPRRMFFGYNQSTTWGPGGVAFLDLQRNYKEKAYVRIYKITLEQFNDVLQQENDRDHVMTSPLLGFTDLKTIRNKKSKFVTALKKGWYRTVAYLGEVDKLPVLTFTCPPRTIEDFRSQKTPLCAPSNSYKNIIIKALVEGKQLSKDQANDYIKHSYEKPLSVHGLNSS